MRELVLSVLCVSSALVVGRGQEGWEVSGTVTADSRPVRGMYVRMLGPSSIPSVVTDSRGAYSVKGVVPGRYTISLQN